MQAEYSIRLNILKDMLKQSLDISFWEYSPDMELIYTNCEDSALMETLFSLNGCKQIIQEVATERNFPMLLSDSLLLFWLSIPAFDENILKTIYILGPVFGSYTSENSVTSGIEKLHLNKELKMPLLSQLKSLPIVLRTTLLSYGILIDTCIHKRKIDEADIQMYTQDGKPPIPRISSDDQKPAPRNSFEFEQRYFSAVAEGNIYFKAPTFYDPSEIGKLADTSIRHAKNQMIVKITLASRAAILGGLPESIAFAISDQFILLTEECVNINDVYNYGQLCVQEFTKRVHKIKQQTGEGRELQKCYAYIEAHLTEKINYARMAAELGYNRQYLSTKFKHESGMTLSEFVLKKRIVYAKRLLRNSSYSILEISQMLQFSSCSYFSAQFRKVVGMTPTEYQNATISKEEDYDEI
ncbi:hypothetical protein C808_02582 [Lachnospiraceae bacterium M18-1]|nr:hypothetical protein C808_02582 [Lachnospiraceae bacterium M18-1]